MAISDLHERRLGESAEALAPLCGAPPPAIVCDVTQEDQVRALRRRRDRGASATSTC